MFGVTILGCNSAIPTEWRKPTSQAVYIDDQILLLDCGEGTQMQMNLYKIRSSKIKNIFISHLHGDHYFGLIGLLNSMNLKGRKDELHLFAPEPVFQLIDLQMKFADSVFNFPFHKHPLEEGEILSATNFTVTAFKVKHRIECFGFAIKEKQKLRKLNIEEINKHSISISFFLNLKKGKDYISPNGELIKNEQLTFPSAKEKSYAFCADTYFTESFLPFINNVDLLYHEATYLKDMEEKAFQRFHSTAEQAAKIAKAANAKRLIIGHYSSKYNFLEPFEREAKSVFENTELAREGITFIV